MSSREVSSRDGYAPHVYDHFVTSTIYDRHARSHSQDEAVALLEKRGESRTGPAPASNVAVDSRFPYRQFLVFVACLAIEPIAFSTVVTYSFPMVQWMKGESNASFYAGLYISVYTLAEGSVAMFWGHVSDRYGRKPVWLLSLTGLLLSTTIIGVTSNYWIALSARALGGLLNGSVALTPTIVSELVKRPEHETAAFAVPPLSWNVGWILGCMIGGYAAEPSQLYPKYFSEGGLFGRLPYLLPSLITSGLLAMAIMAAYLFFDETHPRIRASQTGASDSSALVMEETHDTSRLTATAHVCYDTMVVEESPLSADQPPPGALGFLSASPHLLKSTNMATVTHAQGLEDPGHEESSLSDKSQTIFSKGVLLWTGAIFLLSFHDMSFTNILPIYTLDEPQAPPRHLDLQGGLGASLQVSGEYGAFCGFVAMVIQTLYLLCAARSAVPSSVVLVVMLCPLVYLMVPFITLLSDPSAGMYIILMLKAIITFVPGPSLIIFLKNSAQSPLVLGRVMGFSMTVCGVAKTVAPPLSGIIYSRFGSAPAWWLTAFLAGVAAVELGFAYYLTPDKHHESEENTIEGR